MASSKYIAGRLQKEILKTLLNVSNKKDLQNNLFSTEINRHQKDSIGRALKNMQNHGLLVLGEEDISLTKEGRRALNNVEIQEISLNCDSWDGVWRVIIYDIPETKRKERDSLRLKIKNLGFRKLQASVWLCPYECKESLALFCHSLKISPYVTVIESNKIPNEDKYLKLFDLELL